MQENYNFNVDGYFKDIIHYPDGTVHDTGWQKNIIADNLGIILSCLLKKEEGYDGIGYWAVGIGDPSWDSAIPSPLASDVKCHNEIFRKAVAPSDITFLTSEGIETVSPTNTIQIKSYFAEGEATGEWREFCIFAGNATSVKDSGLNVNRKIHKMLPKESNMAVERRIKFVFKKTV